ncbi:hypothetical protein DRN87_04165 [Candidatus Geothermarchaeota archaeon]|nr:MAG: hypothetical protein DRN87_04165 [Candidatus Geothermarchaeota archaeon]HEW94083.1 hydrogenase maturation protease [Thermoprotei archaeon]
MSNILVVFLGNSIYRDDRIGLIVGNKLRDKLTSLGYNVMVLEETGYELIDVLAGWSKVVIVDSIKTGRHEVGDVFQVNLNEFDVYKRASPHYTGLPETLELLYSLDLNPPKEIYLIGIEVLDPYTISDEVTPELASKIDSITDKVYKLILNILGRSSISG